MRKVDIRDGVTLGAPSDAAKEIIRPTKELRVMKSIYEIFKKWQISLKSSSIANTRCNRFYWRQQGQYR